MVTYSEEFQRERVSEAALERGYTFHGWSSTFSGSSTKIHLECYKHGEWKTTNINHFMRPGSGCPQCAIRRGRRKDISYYQAAVDENPSYQAGTVVYFTEDPLYLKFFCPSCDEDEFSRKGGIRGIFNISTFNLLGGAVPCRCSSGRRYTEAEAEFMVSRALSVNGYRFLGWADGKYVSMARKVIAECDEHGLFQPNANNLIWGGVRCAKCASYGYDKDEDGYIYTLLSDCKNYVKVGITNNMRLRLNGLRSSTPFGFTVVDAIKASGEDAATAERQIHSDFDSAGLSGFSGSTEWMLYSPDLLDAARLTVGRMDNVQ